MLTWRSASSSSVAFGSVSEIARLSVCVALRHSALPIQRTMSPVLSTGGAGRLAVWPVLTAIFLAISSRTGGGGTADAMLIGTLFYLLLLLLFRLR